MDQKIKISNKLRGRPKTSETKNSENNNNSKPVSTGDEDDIENGAFKNIVGEYEGSKYDVRDLVTEMKSRVKEERQKISLKTEEVEAKVKVASDIVKEMNQAKKEQVMKREEKMLEEFVNLANCSLTREERSEATGEAPPNQSIIVKRKQNLESKASLIKMNKNHQNKELFNFLKDRAMKIFNCEPQQDKYLGVVKVRIELEKQHEADLEDLIVDGDLEVEVRDGIAYGLIHVLIDNGASVSVLDEKLDSYIQKDDLEPTFSNISGIGGIVSGIKNNCAFKIIADTGEKKKIGATFMENITNQQTMSPRAKAVIINEFGMNGEHEKLFAWQGKESKKILGLIGSDNLQLHGCEVDPHDLNMIRPICSPNLKICFVPIAAEKQLFIKGYFGVDSEHIDDNDPDCLTPTFRIDTEDKSKLRLWDISTLDTLENEAAKMNADVDEYICCAAEVRRKPDTVTLEEWRRKQLNPNIEIEQEIENIHTINIDGNISIAEEVLMACSTAKEENTGVVEDCIVCNVVQHHVNSVEDREDVDVRLNKEHITALKRYIQSAEDKILLTVHDESRLAEFMKIEEEWSYHSPLCHMHQEMTRRCQDCRREGSATRPEDLKLEKEYEDGLILIDDEDNPGRKRIVQSRNFMLDAPELGEMKNNMYLEAEQSSRSMLKKLMKVGKHALLQIEQQWRKMINRHAVTVLTRGEVIDILQERTPANFLCRNYVEKPSSENTAYRLVADTSRMPPRYSKNLASSQRCPKNMINSLLTANFVFHSHQHLREEDLRSAYWSIHMSRETSMMTLSVWFHKPLQHNDKQIILLRSRGFEFGQGCSGAQLQLAIKKFPGNDLTGYLKDLITETSYVDNFGVCSQTGDKLELQLLSDHVKKVFRQYGLDLDNSLGPDESTGVDTGHEEKIIFGERWNMTRDETMSAVKLNQFKSHRGRQLEPGLSHCPLSAERVTRRIIARLVSQLYDCTGRHIQIVINSARLMLSTVCEVAPAEKLDTPITEFSPEVAAAASDFFNSIKNINNLPGTTRFVIPAGYEPEYAVSSHDASPSGYAATLHIICRKKLNNICAGPTRVSTIAAARSTISRGSVHDNETRSFPKSMELINTWTKACGRFLPHNFQFFITGDNIPATSVFTSTEPSKSMICRNSKLDTQKNVESVLQMLPGCRLVFSWQDSRSHPSDKISKFCKEPLLECVTDFWRSGPESFLHPSLLTKFQFMECSSSGTNTFKLSTCIKSGTTTPDALIMQCVMMMTHDHRILGTTNDDQEDVAGDIADVQNHPPLYETSSEQESLASPADISNHINKIYVSISSPSITTNHTPALDVPVLDSILRDTRWIRAQMLSDKSNNIIMWASESHLKSIDHVLVLTRAARAKLSSSASLNNDMRTVTGTHHDPSCAPIISPGTQPSTPWRLHQDSYQSLATKKSEIDVNIRILAHALMVIDGMMKRKYNLNAGSAVKEACLIMFRADQKFAPPRLSKDPAHYKRSELNEIIFSRRNINTKQDIFTVTDSPILDSSSPLARLILDWAHREKNSISFGVDMHLPSKTTKINTLTGQFAAKIIRLSKTITAYMRSCSVCLRAELKFYRTIQGACYTRVNKNSKVFSDLSFDPLGRLEVCAWKKSKKKIQVYPILFKCLNTGAVWCTLSESIDSAGINTSLRRLSFVFGVTPQNLTHDCQPSFTDENLNPRLEDGTKLYKGVKFTKLPAKAQQRNYAESSVNTLKRILCRIFKTSKNEPNNKLSSLTVMELLLIIEKSVLVANSIPYNTDTNFSPANILYPGKFLYLPDLPINSAIKKNYLLRELEQTLDVYNKMIEEERTKSMLEHEGRFLERMKSNNKFVNTGYTAKIDDIVLLKPTNEFVNGVLGRIVSLPSNTTAVIRTARGTFKRMISEVHPIHSCNTSDSKESNVGESSGDTGY